MIKIFNIQSIVDFWNRKILRKKPPTIVKGQFDQLFRPGLRKEFFTAFKIKEDIGEEDAFNLDTTDGYYFIADSPPSDQHSSPSFPPHSQESEKE